MADPKFVRARKVFAEAIELPEGRREAFVLDACGDDADLQSLVLELLESHAELPDDYLETRAPVLPEFLNLMRKDGLLFGDFQIESMLGEGGAGIVYLAMQRSLNRRVALKVLRPVAESDMRSMNRFVDEAKSAARLSHSGIAQVFTAGSESGIPYFSMEFVPGTTLADCIRALNEGKPAPPLPATNDQAFFRAVAELVRDCADALTYAHAEKILHRDIKPENILIDASGKVKIVDFGLARDEQLGRHSKTGTIEGTPHYMSPEQARAAKDEIDERTDVYSLGVVLYELLTLRRPFADGSLAEVLQRVAREEPPLVEDLNSRVPGDLAAVCHKAMRRSLSARYASARELRNELQRFLDHVPTIARPASALDRAERVVRMHRRKFIAGGLVVLGASLGLGGAAYSKRVRERDQERRENVRFKIKVNGTTRERYQVFVQEIDWNTTLLGPHRFIGHAPDDEFLISPGYRRITVIGDSSVREFAREFELGQRQSIAISELTPYATSKNSLMIPLPATQVNFDDCPPPFNGVADVLPFKIDPCEVSVRDFREFAKETDTPSPPHFLRLGPESDHLPATGIDWQTARNYAEWRGVRLPTYIEWTRAARGSENRLFPWSDSHANKGYRGNTEGPEFNPVAYPEQTYESEFLASIRTQSPLDALPSATDEFLVNSWPVTRYNLEDDHRTPDGLLHMLGNVSEWTESATPGLQVTLQGHTVQTRERIVAGHAWDARALNSNLQGYTWTRDRAHDTDLSIGFRCATSTPQS